MKKRELISLFFFLSLILIILMDSALFLPNEVLIIADLDIYFDSIGFIIGVYTIVSGVSVLMFGYLTDLIQRKKILIFAGCLWSITAILHIFIEAFWQLFLTRIVAAIAVSVTTPLVISYLADIISSDSRSKSFAFWGIISSIGSLVAGAIALAFNAIDYDAIELFTIPEKINHIIQYYPDMLYTWRLPFFYLGVIALILTILNFLITIEPKRAAKEKSLEKVLTNEDQYYSYKIKFSDLKFIFKRKSNIFLMFNFFDVIASGLLVAYLFPYIQLGIGVNIGDLRVIILLLFAVVLGLIIGQFGLAHWGDKKIQSGDLSGRVKVAVICSILNIPFLLFAFAMSPNGTSSTFFFGSLIVNDVEFWVLWLIYCIFIGIGLAFTMGIGPNWYSSLIDLNFPEDRGTMIAVGSFIDTIGRASGVAIGGYVITMTGSFSATFFWSTLIFGLISICFWVPLFFTAEKDYKEINEIMKKRAVLLSDQEVRDE